MTLTSPVLASILSDTKTSIGNVFTHIAFGEDSTASLISDTELGLEVLRKARDAIDTTVANQVTVSGSAGASEANGNTIRETGWFNAGSLVVDNCNVADWSDSVDMTTSLNTADYKEGEKSLNLIKDNTGSATASTSKTTTSRDFTGKDFTIWIKIIDAAMLAKLAASDCITIRFGSDSSNYYQWTKDAADLAVGWNLIKGLNSGNATVVSSPVIAACDYTYIGITATGAAITWSAGDLIMDYIVLISGTLECRDNPTAIVKIDSVILYFDTTVEIDVIEVI